MQARDWPLGDGEMAGRMRDHDWAATPLGPIEGWPQSLRTTIDLILAQGFPMIVLWGPERIGLYNDAFRSLLGDRRPALLGRPLYTVWPELRDIHEPSLLRAWAGQTVVLRDAHYPGARHRPQDEAWFDASVSPLRNEAGETTGLLATAFETTERVRAGAALRESGERSPALATAGLQEEVASAKLRDSEGRYRSLVDSIDQGFCTIEMIFDEAGRPVDYRFLDVNPAFERHTGLEAAAGKRMRELAPDHEQHWFDIYGRIALTGEPQEFENRAQALNGRWYDVYAVRVGYPEQRRVAILFRDMTARRRAEEALRDSQERLSLALEVGRFATWDWNLLTGAVTWNDRHFLLQGYAVGEVEPSYQAWLDRVHPDDRDETAAKVVQAREQGTDYAHQYRSLLPDGTVRWCAARGRFFHGPDGTPRRMVGVMEDVTERHRAETALHDSEERFRQFAEASSDVLWIRSADTLVMEYLSAAFERVYGEGRDELLGEGVGEWSSLIHPDDRAGAVAALERVRAGSPVTHEFRIVRPGGGTRWIENTDFPLFDAEGRLQRIGGFARDVTAAKQAGERQRLLLAELQHRVRNILAMVRSLVRRSGDGARSVEELLKHLEGRIDALARTQVLLTRRSGAGIDLSSLIFEELGAQAAEIDRVSVDGPPISLAPKAAEVLTLAIHELATNATKYGVFAGADGLLRVSWRVEEEEDGAPWLRLDWVERDVHMTSSDPARSGFGMELIRKRVPYELQGSGKIELGPAGVHCRIEFPLVAGESALDTREPAAGGPDSRH